MKKKIGFVSLSPHLAKWISDKLKSAPPSASKEDLSEALAGLLTGETDSFIVEMGEQEENNEKTTEQAGILTCGDLIIDARTRSVTRKNEEIALTPKEFDILYFLAANRGEVFTKEQIYQAVWEEDYLLDDSNIMAFIRKIRKKIEPNPDAPIYILTIWGIGYKFNDRL